MTRRVNLVPMAGAGQRFVDAGYQVPKPLIDIGGQPMAVRAASCLPPADVWIFVCRREHLQSGIVDALRGHFPECLVVEVDGLTDGQARTCLLARWHIRDDDQLTIGPCDNAMTYDRTRFEQELSQSDVLVWTFRRNPAVLRKPSAYGWVRVGAAGEATEVSCKVPISDTPIEDHAVVGAFSFHKARFFFEAADAMIAQNRRVSGEFYVDVAADQAIRLGRAVRPFEIHEYLAFGTPADLEAYLRHTGLKP